MKISISIMSHKKERGKDGKMGYRHERTTTMSEDELLECLFNQYKEDYPDDIEEDRIYESSIDEITI